MSLIGGRSLEKDQILFILLNYYSYKQELYFRRNITEAFHQSNNNIVDVLYIKFISQQLVFMRKISQSKNLQKQSPKTLTLASLQQVLLKNTIFINNQFIGRSYQKENHLGLLILNDSAQLFCILQLVLLNSLAFGCLSQDTIYNLYKILQQQLFVLEFITIGVISIKLLSLLFLMFANNSQKYFYKLLLQLALSTRIIYSLFIPVYSLRLGNLWLKDIIFCLLGVLYIAQCSIFSNFVNRYRNDYSCNMKNSFFQKIFSILAVWFNTHYIYQKSKTLQFFIVFLAWGYLIWYIKVGSSIYLNKVIKKVHFLLSTAYISLSMVFSISLVHSKQTTITNLLIQITITFLGVFVFLRFCESQNIQSTLTNLEQLKVLQFQLLKLGRNQQSRFNAFQLGFIFMHQQSNCPNETCYTKSKQLYDSQNNKFFLYNEKLEKTELRIKLIIKCQYESLLKKQPQNKQLLINYLEFSYSELKNQWVFFKVYKILTSLNLIFFQKVKIQTIFLQMKLEKQRLNRRIYQSKMQIQNILNAQDTFISILNLIQEYFFKRIEIVNSLISGRKVQLQNLKKRAVQSFQTLSEINDKWKVLQNHHRVNKKWEYFHIICFLFLSNKCLSKKMIQTLNLHQNGQTQAKPILLSQNQQLENQQTLFHFQSFYIHATNENDDIIIKRISKNAQKFLKYQQNELIGSKIERLMVQELKQTHYSKLKAWFQKGFNSNEYTYDIKFSKIVNKFGKQIDAIKYFKILLTEKGQMDYVCLIKINTQQPAHNFRTSQKELKKIFEFSIYLNQFNEIQPERISIFQEDKSMQTQKPQMQMYLSSYKKHQTNIFVKDENLVHVVQNFYKLQPVKKTSRLYFALVAIFMAVTAQYTNNQLASTTEYSSDYLNFMTAYRLPILLNINYMKAILNMGNQTTIKNQIKSQTAQYMGLVSNPSVISTVHDRNLNKKQQFAPIPADQSNRNLTYDQIDLFYQIASQLSTLSTLPVNRTGISFKMLNSYLFPSYSTVMNNSKYEFHNNFQILLSDSQQTQIKILMGFVFATFVVFGFILYQIKQSFGTLGCVTNILSQMRPNYLQRIALYDKSLLQSFQNFTFVYKEQHACSKIPQFFQKKAGQEDQKRPTRQIKHKEVIADEQMKKVRICIYFAMCLLCTICILFLVSSKLITVKNLSDLADFQLGGFSFLRYYPTAPIVGLGVFDKFYSLSYPQQKSFYPEKYTNGLFDMIQFGHAPYLTESQDQSLFYAKRRNYFFGNPCRYNTTPLAGVGTNISQCEAVFNGVYKRGLISYFRQAYRIGNDYINGNMTLNASQVSQYALGVSITSTYVLDAIATWSQQFNINVGKFQSATMILAFFCGFLTLLLHVLVLQLLVFRKMQNQFQIEKQLFNHFIPQVLLVKQKVVFQDFVKNGLIYG